MQLKRQWHWNPSPVSLEGVDVLPPPQPLFNHSTSRNLSRGPESLRSSTSIQQWHGQGQCWTPSASSSWAPVPWAEPEGVEGHRKLADATRVRTSCCSTAWRERGAGTAPSGDLQHISETPFLFLVCFSTF